MSALAVAGLFTACDKNDPEPIPGTVEPGGETVTWPKAADGIANQFQYNSAELVDIKNVVYAYSEEEGTYCFAFSTAEGEESVEGVLKNDEKAAVLIVPTVNGAVDTTKIFGFQLGDGKELSVLYNKLTGKEHSVKVSVTLKDETHAAVSIEYIGEKTPESPYFFLKYDGEVVKEAQEPEPLDNEMEREDGTRTELGSVILQRTHSGLYSDSNTIALAFFKESGVNLTNLSAYKSVLRVSFALPADASSEIDFGTGKDFVVIAGDDLDFDSEDGGNAEGKLEYFVNDGNLSVDLSFKTGDKAVSAVYEGDFVKYVYATNDFTLDLDTDDEDYVTPSKIFRAKTSDEYHIVFGSNEAAETPEALKEGDYAVSVKFPISALGKDFKLTKESDFTVEIYDYAKGTTTVYDKENLADYGCVMVDEDGENIYIHLEELETENGHNIDGSYYGAVTDTEIPDLTPAPAFTPTITITNEDGSQVLFQETITRMEVCHFVDTYDFAGKLVNGYGFYFVNAKSDADVDDNKYTNTPLFILPDSEFGCENLDLASASASDPELYWSIAFANTNLSVTAAYSPAAGTYGYDITNYSIYRVPENVTLTAKKDGKNWDFKLVLKDWGPFGMSYTGSAPEANGTKNILTIEWHGPATKYSGTKYSNTLTDQDY